MIYLDSSALVKRYLKEAGTEKVKSLSADADIIATSKLTYPEMLSAFKRKYNNKDITKTEFHTATENFEADWDYFLIIEFKDDLLKIIKGLVTRHNLKGADSVHLASALWLKQTIKEHIAFVASDSNLLKAARAEKLEALNPQEG